MLVLVWENVGYDGETLPAGNRRLLAGCRHERRLLDQLHLVNVPRAARYYGLDSDADDELRTGIAFAQWVVACDTRGTHHAHARLALKIHEQQRDLARLVDVARREVHAVAIVIGEGKRALVDNGHEAV